MGFFSSLFSSDKTSRINDLKKQIENHKKSIDAIKSNMASARANKAPRHYQESGKQKIAVQKGLIASCNSEISYLNKK